MGSKAKELCKWKRDEYAREMRSELALVRQKLGEPGCWKRVARMLLDLIELEGQGN